MSANLLLRMWIKTDLVNWVRLIDEIVFSCSSLISDRVHGTNRSLWKLEETHMLAIVLEVAVRRSDMNPSNINSGKKNPVNVYRKNIQKIYSIRIIKHINPPTFFHFLQCSKQRFSLCLLQPLLTKQKLKS